MLRRALTVLSLLVSSLTLFCCALPAFLIVVGFGVTEKGVMEAMPVMAWLAAHQTVLFAASALLLVFAGQAQWQARLEPCPLDGRMALKYRNERRQSFFVYVASLLIFLFGIFFTYIAPWLVTRYGSSGSSLPLL